MPTPLQTELAARFDRRTRLPNEAGECRAKDPAHCRVHGTPEPASKAAVAKFLKELPGRIEPETAEALLSAGFDDTDGAGNTVRYGSLLLDHLDRDSHSTEDRLERKRRLGMAVKMIRGAKPIATARDGGKERVYAGIVDGDAYLAVADEHGEMDAMLMVSYRRGKRKEVRNA